MAVRPSPALHYQFDRLLNLPLIRIALLDDRYRHAVRAEYDLGLCGFGKPRQRIIDFLDQRVQVKRMTIKSLNRLHRNVITEQAPEFVEAAAGCSAGILRIERQKHDFVAVRGPQLVNRLRGKRMPVPHGDKTVSVDAVVPETLLQRIRLLLGKAPYGGRSADGRVVVLNFLGPGGGDQFGQWFTANAGKREVDDIGVAEKIKKKRLNRLRRVGAAELKENYS